MKQNLTFKGKRRSDGSIVEQVFPVETEDPSQTPAIAAALLQKLFGIVGLVCKDPNVSGRVLFIPATELTELWCDIPSIVVVDALEGQDLIRP